MIIQFFIKLKKKFYIRIININIILFKIENLIVLTLYLKQN